MIMRSNRSRLFPLLVALVFTLPGVGSAQSSTAYVQSLSGTCMVSRGESLETVSLGMPLAQGDIVTCTEGGAATVVYNNDCAVEMPAESQLPIGSGEEPCKVAAAALVVTGGAAAASVLASNTGLIALGTLGAAAVVGGIVYAASQSGGDDTGPVSPE